MIFDIRDVPAYIPHPAAAFSETPELSRIRRGRSIVQSAASRLPRCDMPEPTAAVPMTQKSGTSG